MTFTFLLVLVYLWSVLVSHDVLHSSKAVCLSSAAPWEILHSCFREWPRRVWGNEGTFLYHVNFGPTKVFWFYLQGVYTHIYRWLIDLINISYQFKLICQLARPAIRSFSILYKVLIWFQSIWFGGGTNRQIYNQSEKQSVEWCFIWDETGVWKCFFFFSSTMSTLH